MIIEDIYLLHMFFLIRIVFVSLYSNDLNVFIYTFCSGVVQIVITLKDFCACFPSLMFFLHHLFMSHFFHVHLKPLRFHSNYNKKMCIAVYVSLCFSLLVAMDN